MNRGQFFHNGVGARTSNNILLITVVLLSGPLSYCRFTRISLVRHGTFPRCPISRHVHLLSPPCSPPRHTQEEVQIVVLAQAALDAADDARFMAIEVSSIKICGGIDNIY